MPLLTGDDGFNPDETIDMTNFKNKQASKKIMILKKEIHIEKRRFLISNSFMLLMKMVYEYLKYLVSKEFTDFEPIAKIKDVIMVLPYKIKNLALQQRNVSIDHSRWVRHVQSRGPNYHKNLGFIHHRNAVLESGHRESG